MCSCGRAGVPGEVSQSSPKTLWKSATSVKLNRVFGSQTQPLVLTFDVVLHKVSKRRLLAAKTLQAEACLQSLFFQFDHGQTLLRINKFSQQLVVFGFLVTR